MHSVLFVATETEKHTDWEDFLRAITVKIAKSQGVERLGEAVWLVNFQADAAPLGWMISEASRRAISYRMLVFPNAPQWLPVGFDPKPTQGQNESLN